MGVHPNDSVCLQGRVVALPLLASASAHSCHTGATYNSLAPCLSFCDPKPRSWPPSWLFHSPYPSALALTTCLSLSVGEDLTADPRHARNGVGNDWSCSEGAQDLGLSPEGSSTDLWVEGEPCSEAEGQERTQGRGKCSGPWGGEVGMRGR